MYCQFCGRELKENTRFCPYCGTGVPQDDTLAPGIYPRSDPYTLGCTNCQAETRVPGARFCRRCGKPLTRPPVPSGGITYLPDPAPAPEERAPAPQTKRSNRTAVLLYVLAALVVVLAVAVVVVWVYFHNRSEEPNGPVFSDSSQPGETDVFEGSQGDPNSLLPGLSSTASPQGSPAVSPSASPTLTQTPTPTPVTPVQPTSDTVVFRNAHPNGRLFVDGVETAFQYVGSDIVVQRTDLPDLCQICFVVQTDTTGYDESVLLWFDAQNGNEANFDVAYGGYGVCYENGISSSLPNGAFLTKLLEVYHESFLMSINDQTEARLAYSTQTNTEAEKQHIFSDVNSRNRYDTEHYSVEIDWDSQVYDPLPVNGKLTFNATFVSHATNRETGNEAEVVSRKTIELLWEGHTFKVNRLAFVSDKAFSEHQFAELP